MRNGLPFDYAEYLLKNESNIEMDSDVDTKQENPKLETAYGETLATASKEEFSKDSIPQPKNHVNRKYSLSEKHSDDAYLSAVERGDIETAQRMVDKAAKAAGYTEEMFHGMGGRYNVYKSESEEERKNNAPKLGRYVGYFVCDQITRTRRTASRAVRSASTVAGTEPVTSKMV